MLNNKIRRPRLSLAIHLKINQNLPKITQRKRKKGFKGHF